MYTTEKIINRFKEIHGDKYDYSKVVFVKTTIKVCIICPEHGEFWQEPHAHLKGQGCPKCGLNKRIKSKTNTNEEFINKAKLIYGDEYDYSLVNYVNNKTPIEVICKKHGVFKISPNSHIGKHHRGCPKCGNSKKGNNRKLDTLKFINKANAKHGNFYDYSKVNYINSNTDVEIICPEHGPFLQQPAIHLMGSICPMCAVKNRIEKTTKTTNDFVEQAKKIHGEKYDYSKVVYKKGDAPVTIICPEHGEFYQKPINHLNGCGCQKCGMLYSRDEIEIGDYIASIIGEENIIRNDRSILDGCEIDIYIPSLRLAFEIDGLYWHSEIKKDNKYHLQKTIECEKNNIQLIHIFEDEWKYKRDICESRISNLLGVNKRVFGRKCNIEVVDKKTAKKFFTENHIQGNVNASIIYGLKYNGELVSAMSFGGYRKNMGRNTCENSYEMLRFCNKLGYNIIGGASKLFKHFIKHNKPIEVISYADRRWSMGRLYEKLNFKFIHESEPSYFYIIGNERKNRFGFRKDVLISKYGCPKDMTEREFCYK